MAATLVLGAGCRTCNRESSANYAPISTGGMGNEYGTESGQYSSGGDVVIPLEKEQAQVGTQRVDQGGVRIRKFVRTETINEPVQVREETVSVDRVPGGAQGNANTALNTPFQSGEITIPLVKEQPVVTTQVVPDGAVVIHRQETTQQMNVPAQVRQERVVAEPVGNPANLNISQDLRRGERENEEPYAQGAPGASYGQSSGTSGQPITQLNQLCNTSDTASLYNSQVNISNVKVDRVLNDQLIQVRADNGTKFFVHIDQPTQGLHRDQIITLNGAIKQVPSDPSTLGWDPASAQAVQGQQLVIDCPSVSPQG
ncbi:MAG TPA: YsnF/AvaK domain-containing protein [Verrucomicrobiae bacterium]|jgi:uncharacterized protein (TIGR02271 family)|nr:YsnF/AvaK domain-containing protein [Verrucomicrobiae bacterium]